jgi:integrase
VRNTLGALHRAKKPIDLVPIKGGSKRRQRPIILTVEQFELIVATLREPDRTMVQIAQCLGLRGSEIAALQWDDLLFRSIKSSCNEAS